MQVNKIDGLGRSVRLMVLAVLGLVLLVVLQFGLTIWFSASELDERERERSSGSVSASLEREKTRLAAGVREHAWWSETIERLVETQDIDWIEFNLGAELAKNYGVSEVIALDSGNRLIYSEHLTETRGPDEWMHWNFVQFQGLIAKAQATPVDAPIPFAAFLRKGEQLYLVAACAITATDGDISGNHLDQYTRPTLIFTMKIDGARLSKLGSALSIIDLTWNPGNLKSGPGVPLQDVQGSVIGHLTWSMPLAGTALVLRVLLWSSPIILSCILLLMILFRRSRGVVERYQEITVRSAVARQSQDYFQSMADHAPMLIWQTDLRGQLIYANEAFDQVWRQTGTSDAPRAISDLAVDDEKEALLEFFGGVCSSGQSSQHECKLHGDKENARWLSMEGTPQLGKPGQIDKILFCASDITDRKNAEMLAWDRANFDSLTNLPNRSLFQDRLGVELAQAERSGHPVGLMFIDLDNFKNINDSLGHSAGDLVLQLVADRISGCLRKPDTVGRLGGDEFVVLMPEVSDRADFGKVARRIKEALTSQMAIENMETCLSASIGIAVYPEDGDDIEALMMNADTAMYRAKHNGRNSIVYYDASMNDELKSAIKMETDLRQAMRDQQLYLEYQPIYNSATVEVTGVEALCRWQGKDGKMVPPDQFIPVAERAGLMNELGDYLLVLACKQLREWLAEGRDIYVAVNISPTQFMDRNFPERVKELIEEYEIGPEHLQLELTERLLLDDSDGIVNMLNTLADCGIKLAVDDFGTGYSALSYLRRFPVHILKVDRSFVNELPGSTRDQALVKAIITMAHSLGLNVVAEGVETREQCDFLLAQDCELMQGYLYGRPVPAEQLWEQPGKVVQLRDLSA